MQNYGAGKWAMAPAGLRGVINNELAIYFPDTRSRAVLAVPKGMLTLR